MNFYGSKAPTRIKAQPLLSYEKLAPTINFWRETSLLQPTVLQRKVEAYASDVILATRAIREPRVVVQTTSEVDIMDDGHGNNNNDDNTIGGCLLPNVDQNLKCKKRRMSKRVIDLGGNSGSADSCLPQSNWSLRRRRKPGCSLSIHGVGLENSVGIENPDGTLQGVEAKSECQDVIGSRGVTSPESTIQTLPSFEEYTPPVTYSEEVEMTLGTLIEVEPLNETKLEEVGLNCNHNTPLSSREVPSFDKPVPQPQPLPKCPPLDARICIAIIAHALMILRNIMDLNQVILDEKKLESSYKVSLDDSWRTI
nr:probable WRKY transcription factor 2 [Tanacetum cinerariifolium]